MSRNKERFNEQLANFRKKEEMCQLWFTQLLKILNRIFPREIVFIIDDYSNEHFQIKTWYIAMCQSFLTSSALDHNVHFITDGYAELKALQYKPTNKLTFDERVEMVWVAHQNYNEELLQGSVHPGCSQMGISCDDACEYCAPDSEEFCTWEYDAYRCECGNYKGFKWKFDEYTDWISFSLFSEEWLGYQVRMW